MNKLTEKYVPAVGLGCMGMSEFYGDVDDAESLHTLEQAYAIGYRHFDTADMYGNGHNEALLGKFIQRLGDERDQIVLASKVGIQRNKEQKYSIALDGSRDYIKRACEASLRRLGVDCIDLYYLHRRDPATPVAESVGAMAELVKEGKIKAIGLCEVSVDTLKEAAAVHPISAVQSEYSLWTREAEGDVLPACRELGIPFVAYSPMGRGFLSGTMNRQTISQMDPATDLRAVLPRFGKDNIDHNLDLLEQFKAISQASGLKTSQLALAWIMSKHDHVHVIPGTKKVAYLTENFKSGDCTLDAATVAQLDQLFHPAAVSGARYPTAILSKSEA